MVENTQLKKSVGELKDIINSCRPSSFSNRSLPLTSAQSSTDQPPQSGIRLLVREKLHKRSSSDLQQSLSSIDISMRPDEEVVSRVCS